MLVIPPVAHNLEEHTMVTRAFTLVTTARREEKYDAQIQSQVETQKAKRREEQQAITSKQNQADESSTSNLPSSNSADGVGQNLDILF